ncbi:MAG: flagellar basal body P-ring protein FlgI [Anaeromyxobacter sp.]
MRTDLRRSILLCAALLAGVLAAPTARGAEAVRVKDLGKLRGWRENALVGYGIVTGLAGTGDSPNNRTTRQTLSNVLSQFNLTVPADQIQSRNVAVVMVSASLPPFSREGDTLDVTVTSAGDARSLLGGSLLLTPLKGPDGVVHALAQGPLSVGGYRYDANGNVVQKNHPTVGSVPGGATVEVGVSAQVMSEDRHITFLLADPDYTTADRIAAALNSELGGTFAEATDASAVSIKVPDDQPQLVRFVARLEAVTVDPDRRARVVVNERTGTVVAGGDVRISPVAITHGDLKVSIVEENYASQPGIAWRSGPGVRTEIVTNTYVNVHEGKDTGVVTTSDNNTVADLVQSLARLKTNSRDIISILQAIKTAGALRAELVIQ